MTLKSLAQSYLVIPSVHTPELNVESELALTKAEINNQENKLLHKLLP